jgi:hypothetical protein
MHRILAVGEIHRLGYVKPQHSNEGLIFTQQMKFPYSASVGLDSRRCGHI